MNTIDADGYDVDLCAVFAVPIRLFNRWFVVVAKSPTLIACKLSFGRMN